MNPVPTCTVCGQPLPPEAPEGLCPRCLLAGALHTTGGVRHTPPSIDAVRAAFPQLEVEELIGQGGMGAVFRVRQPALDRRVALKILASELTGDARFAARFRQEAQALARLSHPHIVTIHDFGQSGGFYYLLMECVDGVNLRQAMQAGRFTPEQALAIVPPVCDALQYAHEHGVVHRDIKPENLLLDKTGGVKIADFGIARLLFASTASPESPGSAPAAADGTQFAGTPPYMAPEQRTSPAAVDHRADIYALGVVLYEMLTGEQPGARLEPPSRKVQIDVRLDEVVLRALETQPGLRYASATEFKTGVESVTAAGTRPETGKDKPGARSRFSRMALVGAGWSFFAFLAAAFLNVAKPEGGPGQTLNTLGWVCILTILPLGLTAPFGTTLLGWISVGRIRRSAGNLHGLWLAVFDGLLFLLLALNALIGWFCWWVLHDLLQATAFVGDARDFRVEHLPVANATALSVLATILISLAVDFFIVRRVWRAVNGHTPTPGAGRSRSWAIAASVVAVVVGGLFCVNWLQRPRPLGGFISATSPDGRYEALASTWHAMRVLGEDELFYRFNLQGKGGSVSQKWEIPVPVGEIAPTSVSEPLDYFRFDAHGRIAWLGDDERVSFSVRGVEVFSHTVSAGRDSSPKAKTFGPVVERTIPLTPPDAPSYIDFQTGSIFSNDWKSVPAAALDQTALDWMRQTGADACANEQPGVTPRLVGARGGCVFAPDRTGADFENLEAGDAAARLQEVNERKVNWEYAGESVPYWFRTGDGATGVMQLTGLTENPRGVKIRYRLVQSSAAKPPAPSVVAAVASNADPKAALESFLAMAAADATLGKLIERKDAPGALAWLDHTMPPHIERFLASLTGTELEQRARVIAARMPLLRADCERQDWPAVETWRGSNPDKSFEADLRRLAEKSDASAPSSNRQTQPMNGETTRALAQAYDKTRPPASSNDASATGRTDQSALYRVPAGSSVRLPDGTVVQLMALSSSPRATSPWWSPNGAMLWDPGWREDQRDKTGTRSPSDQTGGYFWRQIVVAAQGGAQPAEIVEIRFGEKPGAYGNFRIESNYRPHPGWTGYVKAFPDGTRTSDITLLIATGAYESEASGKVTHFEKHSMVGELRGQKFNFGQLTEREGNAAIPFSLTIEFAGMFPRYQHQVRAETHHGRSKVGRIVEGRSADNLISEVWQFNGIKPVEVKAVHFELRPLYTIEFQDAVLHRSL